MKICLLNSLVVRIILVVFYLSVARSTVFQGVDLKEKCLFLIGHITCLEMLIESRAEVDCRDKKVSGGYSTAWACT